MAFDFKGTFNFSQLKRFEAFARAQKADLVGRITHLVAEQQRIGALSFAFSASGVPSLYVPEDGSYIGKLVAAYEVLGGDPFFDLNIRTRSQAIFLKAGDETTPGQVLSNGEILGTPGKADAQSGELMDDLRGWMYDAQEYKREYLERKIRRAVDYAEQLSDEITLLTTIASAVDVEGSFENVFSLLTQLINSPTYRAVYDDKGKDPMGLKTEAPFKPYAAGPLRAPDDLWGKNTGTTGVIEPGETV